MTKKADSKPALELDPNDPFEAVLYDIITTNRKKRKDYAGDGDPFQNFKDSAYQINSTAGMAAEHLIAVKQSRLRTVLTPGREVQNESAADTILDRAVYSIIALALYRAGEYETPDAK